MKLSAYRALRERLWNPPNAVPDTGINMRNGKPVRHLHLVPDPAPVVPATPAPVRLRSIWTNKRTKQLIPYEAPPELPKHAPVNANPQFATRDDAIAKFSIREIQIAVCQVWDVGLMEMLSKRRNKFIIEPRHVAAALATRLTLHSLPHIGRAFGGRDHTTILHAVRKHREHVNAVHAEIGEDADVLAWAHAMHRRLCYGERRA